MKDPARHASWLNAGADQVIEAVAAAGSDLVWTMTGIRPASFWTRRRAHEAAVHLADAQLAAGRDVDLAPGLAADGVDEWLGLIAAGTAGPAPELRGDWPVRHRWLCSGARPGDRTACGDRAVPGTLDRVRCCRASIRAAMS